MEITEFEKKRAANLIWNGAQDYTIRPGFRVYDREGKADVYWNSIVGAIHKHYDWAKLQLFYRSFNETVDQGLYENFFWLALENAAFEREKELRPVFPYLREQYAKRMLGQIFPGISESRADWILEGHLRHALGEDSGLPDLVDRKLLAELEIGADKDTDEIIDSLAATLARYFTYLESSKNKEKKESRAFSLAPLLFWKRAKKKTDEPLGPVRRLAFGYGEHTSEYGSAVLDQSHLSVAYASYTAQTDEGLREYITNYFGKSLYSKKDLDLLEKRCCEGSHADVHLHFTRGEYTPEMLAAGGYAGKMHARLIEQEKLNTAAYDKQAVHHRLALEKLTGRIRNSMMTHLDAQDIRSNAGSIDAGRIWRAVHLDDDRIFTKEIRGDNGNITVDLLLDASTSQIHRQETVAAQGYMIAEALTRCQIPVKVYSFCSMNGYMIVNLFRDYEERAKNREIFRYATTGANRDGLAVRLAADMLKQNTAEHRILIVLSDCKPNDVLKVRSMDGQYRDYVGDIGVEDTAAEVHRARLDGITVLCVFTGDDDDLPAVRRIYGRSFARIRSLDMFADTVGSLLQNEIRGL